MHVWERQIRTYFIRDFSNYGHILRRLRKAARRAVSTNDGIIQMFRSSYRQYFWFSTLSVVFYALVHFTKQMKSTISSFRLYWCLFVDLRFMNEVFLPNVPDISKYPQDRFRTDDSLFLPADLQLLAFFQDKSSYLNPVLRPICLVFLMALLQWKAPRLYS